MTNQVLSEAKVSISEFKKNPEAAVDSGQGFPIAVLNQNKPIFYCVPAEVYEDMVDRLDDQELVALFQRAKCRTRHSI